MFRYCQILDTAKELFRKHPLLTNSIIYGSLYMGADFTQQYITKRLLVDPPANKQEPIDFASMARCAITGTGFIAPTLYKWYEWIDRKFPGATMKVVLKKLMMDELLLTPFILCVSLVGMALMEGADEMLEDMHEKFIHVYVRSLIYWLPLDLINYWLVAPRFRVIYLALCTFGWLNIRCWCDKQAERVTTDAV